MYKIKRFSKISRMSKGIKSSINAGIGGAISGGLFMLPLSGLVALFGSKKAGLITAGIGAGVGAGIGLYYGYKSGVERYDYDQKMKNDPEFRAAEMKKKKDALLRYIDMTYRDSLPTSSSKNLIAFRSLEESYNFKFKDDLYKYCIFYEKFSKRYLRKWVDAWKGLDTIDEIDVEFSYVFPQPNPEMAEQDLYNYDPKLGYGGVAVAGNWNCSDHSYIFYMPDRDEYSFELGFGHEGKTIAESLTKFSGQWIVDLNKIEDERIFSVAKIHNDIINEFLRGLKLM